jgi:hypothetical protein
MRALTGSVTAIGAAGSAALGASGPATAAGGREP